MGTWTRPTAPPGPGTVRAALLVGLASAMVVGLTLVARDPAHMVSSSDLDRIEDAVDQGCSDSGGTLAEGTGYALDGTVVEVVTPPARSPMRVRVRVREWFLGPPLEHVEVWLDPTTARHLTADQGAAVVGARLLVSGRGWQGRHDGLVAAGCGRTRGWDAATAEDWRQAVSRPDTARAEGPAATYPSAGFIRTVAEPDLRGVAVLDSGCLYVQDGRTRWVPVLPSGNTAWLGRPAALELGGVATDVGHLIRLTGLPAGGRVLRGVDRPGPADVAARLVDPTGVPEACDPAAPRFVVAEPRGSGAPSIEGAGAAPVKVAVAAAERAGLKPVTADGALVTDSFGATTARVMLLTEGGGELLVHVGSVAVLTWPHAYAPHDAELVRSADPEQVTRLPAVPPGWELAVVSRSDGLTQVLLLTPGRVVVSVTADLATLGPFRDDHDSGVRALTDVALHVAPLSPGGGGN